MNRLIDQSELKIAFNPGLYHFLACSHSGKTITVTQLLLHHEFTLHHPPSRIILFYSFMQPAYQELKDKFGDKLEMIKGYPGISYFEDRELELREKNGRVYVIFDDSDHLLFRDRNTVRLINTFMHHMNLTVFILSQNICVDSPVFREVTRNSSGYVLWDAVRARTSIRNLSRQIFGNNRFLTDALKQLNQGARGYSRPIFVDLQPGGVSDDDLRVRTLLLNPEETEHFVFLPLE